MVTDMYDLNILETRANRNTINIRERILNQFGITASEWLVLGYVAAKTATGGVTVGNIALKLDVQSTYVTFLIRRLESKNLIQLFFGADDRRMRFVSATKEGEYLARKAEEALSRHLKSWLGPEAIEHYAGAIQLLAAGLPAER